MEQGGEGAVVVGGGGSREGAGSGDACGDALLAVQQARPSSPSTGHPGTTQPTCVTRRACSAAWGRTSLMSSVLSLGSGLSCCISSDKITPLSAGSTAAWCSSTAAWCCRSRSAGIPTGVQTTLRGRTVPVCRYCCTIEPPPLRGLVAAAGEEEAGSSSINLTPLLQPVPPPRTQPQLLWRHWEDLRGQQGPAMADGRGGMAGFGGTGRSKGAQG